MTRSLEGSRPIVMICFVKGSACLCAWILELTSSRGVPVAIPGGSVLAGGLIGCWPPGEAIGGDTATVWYSGGANCCCGGRGGNCCCCCRGNCAANGCRGA